MILLLFLLWICGSGLSANSEAAGRLSSVLDSLVAAHGMQGASLSVAIYAPRDTSLVYSHNAGALLVPASLQKLYTAVGALQGLGADHVFETAVGYRGSIQNGVLRGDLVVRGGGDPSWLEAVYPEGPHSVFELWADSLLALGIREVRGDLVADISLFPTVIYNSQWQAGDRPYGYAPSLSPLSFNANMVRYDLFAADRLGRPARMANRFGYVWHEAENRVKTTSRQGADVWLTLAADPRKIALHGELGLGVKDFLNGAVREPAFFALQNIRAALAGRGIKVSGFSREEERPGLGVPPQPLFTFRSVRLGQLLPIILKDSSNFPSEMLLPALGGDYDAGRDRLSSLAREVKGTPDQFRIADACGLSRQNKTSASHLGILLCHAHNQPWFPVFQGSLAVPGEKGTLEKRLKELPEYSELYAKTGTMRGISGLAGYLKVSGGQAYAFAILCNGVPSLAAAKQWQDELISALACYGGD